MLSKTLTAALSLALAGVASAQLYDNGAPNFQNGNEMTNWVQAEDFVLGSPGIAGGASFNLLTFGGLGAWDQSTGQWQIYGDAGGAPNSGDLIGSGNMQDVAVNPLGQQNGFDFYDIRFGFGDSVHLDAGSRYWLALHLTNDYANRYDLYWGTTNSNGPTGHELFMGQEPWNDNFQEHSFVLYEVPAPSAAGLLGLAGLAAGRRRR